MAAIHRGLIQPVNGGLVTVVVLGSQAEYVGSLRNGITSSSYPSFPTSYTFQ